MLLVNDEPYLLLGYTQQLSERFNVLTAENGLEAVELVKDYHSDFFSAIILDLNMPIMDGLEACEVIYK